jgi:RNA polymerase sigma factor (sigma-70 family)
MGVRLPPFQAFLDAHREDVYRFLVVAAGPDHADDCFQETFVAALRAYPRLRDASNLRGWVLTIAHRKAMDAHRARGRGPVPVAAVPERAVPNAAAPADGELWDAVRELSPKQRAAVVHRFVGDLAYRQIGEVMDSSEEAARRNVHDGLKRLREVLET